MNTASEKGTIIVCMICPTVAIGLIVASCANAAAAASETTIVAANAYASLLCIRGLLERVADEGQHAAPVQHHDNSDTAPAMTRNSSL